MKKSLVVGMIIGLVLGIAQVFLVYTTTTSNCSESQGQSCAGSDVINFYRGWPLSTMGEPGYNDSFSNPPITSLTYINILIVLSIVTVVTVLISTLANKLEISHKSYMVLAAALIIGMILGIGQIFYSRNVQRQTQPFDMTDVIPCEQKVPGCGYCPPEQKDGYFCNLPPHEQTVRGWPLSHDTYEGLSRYDKSPTLALNFVLIASFCVLIGGLGSLLIGRSKKKS